MNAEQKIDDLEKLFAKDIIDKKITQIDEEFAMPRGKLIFTGKRTITHYFGKGKLTYTCVQFMSEQYEMIEIEGYEEGSEYPREYYCYEKLQ